MRKKLVTLVLSLMLVIMSILANPLTDYAKAETIDQSAGANTEKDYKYFNSATSDDFTLKVEWTEPTLGEPVYFHVFATGGSGKYLFRMGAPAYANPDENSFEYVSDLGRKEWISFSDECKSQDYEFTMTASGTYKFIFYVMDKTSGVHYLRVSADIQVSDTNYPSVNSIISSAVEQCNEKTDGSDYEKALWLHDWLIQQLDYDESLKWDSAECALTRKLGTDEAYKSAYSLLLTAAGIDNYEIRDTLDAHVWNAIKLDGEWYQVDCTLDDNKNNNYNFDSTHLYFGLTDELMALVHAGHNRIYTESDYTTRSTSLVNNYYVRSGDAEKWAQSYTGRIQKNLKARKTDFEIDADNASYSSDVSDIQNAIIAYALNKMTWKEGDRDVELHVTGDATKFTFSAKYADIEEPINITFDANGGAASKENKAVDYGSIYGELPTPVRNGYTFAGWYTEKSGGEKVDPTTPVTVTENQTLYAMWTVNWYMISFDANGGAASKENKTVDYGSTYGEMPTPVRNGYTFAGWYTEKNGGEKVDSSTPVTVTENQTLYARWNLIKYRIQYKLGKGKNHRSNPTGYTVASKTIVLKKPTRKGYTFKGWYSDSNFKHKITKLPAKSMGNKILYAKWKANKYTIQFVKNGGTGKTMKKMTASFGKSYTLTKNKYTRKGYRFAGWATSPKGKVVYKNKQKIKNLTSSDKTVKKLYAKWIKNK